MNQMWRQDVSMCCWFQTHLEVDLLSNIYILQQTLSHTISIDYCLSRNSDSYNIFTLTIKLRSLSISNAFVKIIFTILISLATAYSCKKFTIDVALTLFYYRTIDTTLERYRQSKFVRRHMRALWQNERTYCLCFDNLWKVNFSNFLTLIVVGRWRPLPVKSCTQ